MKLFRTPKTRQEWKEFCTAKAGQQSDPDVPALRARFRPTAWSDLKISRKMDRSWKHFRQTRWHPNGAVREICDP